MNDTINNNNGGTLKEKMSSNAIWAFIVAMTFTGSVSAEYRIPFYGLMVHPYLAIIPIALVFSKIKMFNVPTKVKRLIIFFFICCFIASLPNKQVLSEPFKIAGGLGTFLFFSQSIQSKKDFDIVELGFIVCAVYISYKAVMLSNSGVSRLAGVNAFEGLGNKNAQSLYTLPGLFLASISLLRSYENKNIIRMSIYGGAIFLILIGVALSANRSGWLGAIIIFGFLMVRMGISLRTIIISSLFVVMGYFAVTNFAADIVEHKMKKTTDGYGSDERRQELLLLSMRVGLEHPFFGVGFDRLLYELGTRLEVDGDSKDPHNLYGALFGGCGIFAFTSFFLFLFNLLAPVNLNYYHPDFTSEYKSARILMVGIVVLFLIRAVFTREILYNPNFMGSIGLIYSYLLFYAKKMNDEQYNYYLEQET